MKQERKSVLGFIVIAVKAFTAVGGSALVLTENHPYWTLFVLGVGAIASEAISYFNIKK